MEIADYIRKVKRKLSESSIVNSFTIVDERIYSIEAISERESF